MGLRAREPPPLAPADGAAADITSWEHADPRLRFLTLAGLPALFEFPPDMARVSTDVNRLSNQVLVQTFEDEWGKVSR